MEEKRGLTIKSLLIRLILIIIFIFLLIWLFPMPNLKPLNDQIFADNIGRMRDVAKSYYTTERLPQNIGDSKRMTLQEMIDNHLILPLVDSNGKYCDANSSYVEITKSENEYLIKVNLSCTDQKNHIIEHFGCYDICSDTCKALEKATTTGKKETSAYKTTKKVVNQPTTVVTSKRKTTTTKKIVDSWVTTTSNNNKIYEYQFVKNVCNDKFDSYTCPSGYVLVGDNCMRYNAETEILPAKEETSILSSVDSKPAIPVAGTGTGVETKDPIVGTETKTSTFAAGYKKETYTAALQTVTQNVSADAYVSEDVKGIVVTKKTITSSYNTADIYDIVDADIIYPDKVENTDWKKVAIKTSTDPMLAYATETEKLILVDTWQEVACPTCADSSALITYYRYFKYKLVTTVDNGTPKYTCDSHPGYKLDGKKCKKYVRTEKSCPDKSWTDTGKECVKEVESKSCESYGKDYKQDGNLCKKTITTYSCPEGTEKTSDPKMCVKKVKDYVCPDNMTKIGSGSSAVCELRHSYYCPENTANETFTLNGTNCTVQQKVSSIKCEEGYTLSSDKKSCIKNNSKTEYTCEGYDGYELKDDKCTKVIDTEIKTYTCEKDYTLDGTDCIKTVESRDTIKAEKKYKTYCTQEYKWSTATSVDGWSYTGNKKQIN